MGAAVGPVGTVVGTGAEAGGGVEMGFIAVQYSVNYTVTGFLLYRTTTVGTEW